MPACFLASGSVRTSTKIPPALRTQARALVGKSLTGTSLDELVWATIFAARKELRGASLDVHRGPGGEGVVVTLNTLDGLPGGWSISSLGVVGLACKTAPTVGEAMRCHQRYQHLINRTARYTASVEGNELTLVLAGGFTDGADHFLRGDVATADSHVDHRPVADADEDCYCLAVHDAPLRLTGSFAGVLNRLIRV